MPKQQTWKSPGRGKGSVSWDTLGSSPGPVGKAGAVTPCHCSRGGHSEHRETWHWGAQTSLWGCGCSPWAPRASPWAMVTVPAQTLQTPQGCLPDPERAPAQSLCSSRLFPSHKKTKTHTQGTTRTTRMPRVRSTEPVSPKGRARSPRGEATPLTPPGLLESRQPLGAAVT